MALRAYRPYSGFFQLSLFHNKQKATQLYQLGMYDVLEQTHIYSLKAYSAVSSIQTYFSNASNEDVTLDCAILIIVAESEQRNS